MTDTQTVALDAIQPAEPAQPAEGAVVKPTRTVRKSVLSPSDYRIKVTKNGQSSFGDPSGSYRPLLQTIREEAKKARARGAKLQGLKSRLSRQQGSEDEVNGTDIYGFIITEPAAEGATPEVSRMELAIFPRTAPTPAAPAAPTKSNKKAAETAA